MGTWHVLNVYSQPWLCWTCISKRRKGHLQSEDVSELLSHPWDAWDCLSVKYSFSLSTAPLCVSSPSQPFEQERIWLYPQFFRKEQSSPPLLHCALKALQSVDALVLPAQTDLDSCPCVLLMDLAGRQTSRPVRIAFRGFSMSYATFPHSAAKVPSGWSWVWSQKQLPPSTFEKCSVVKMASFNTPLYLGQTVPLLCSTIAYLSVLEK